MKLEKRQSEESVLSTLAFTGTEQAFSLLRETLDLSHEAAFLFAVCESEATQQQLRRRLRDYLETQRRSVIEIELSPEQPDLASRIETYRTREVLENTAAQLPPVVFVIMRDLEEAGMTFSFLPEDAPLRRRAEEASSVLRTLNLERERLSREGLPLVFWLNRSILGQVIQWAADLFAARSGIFYLEEVPPLPSVKAMETIGLLSQETSYLSGLPVEELRRRASLYENRLQRERVAEQPNLPSVALLCNGLAAIYGALGDREKAHTFQTQAVEIYRKLAGESPQVFLPALAMSLNNLGNWLSELGQREEALAVAREAVQYYRALAKGNPQAFLPALAASLDNLGNRLSDLGQREEALAASREAVQIRRELAQSNPQAFLPDLAMSLSNLSNVLSTLGRREEALAAAQEAVERYRELARSNPQAFLPNLAMSLTSLGNRLGELRRWEEALATIQEAAEHYRELARGNPQAFLPYLAMSLNNLGNVLSGLGRRKEEALAAYEEALRILFPFFLAHPPAFRDRVQAILENYLSVCHWAGREPDAELVRQVRRGLSTDSRQ